MLKVTTAVCAVFLLFGIGIASQAVATSELVFVEEGILYHAPKDKPEKKKAAASGVERILDHKPAVNKLAYLMSVGTPGTDGAVGRSLVLLDTATWVNQPVASDVITGSLSPDGGTAALWKSTHELHLVQSDGKPLLKIGTRGAAPLFSHDGRLVAYQKLADDSFDGASHSYFEDAQGIALYDVETGQDVLVTDGGMDDFAPVGFSLDMTKLFFNASRPYSENDPQNHVASLWVVDLTNGATTRLTNRDESLVQQGIVVPIINENALWSSDRRTIISSNGLQDGIWTFTFALDGNLTKAAKLADGDSPQWHIPDESIMYRAIQNGQRMWRVLKIQ